MTSLPASLPVLPPSTSSTFRFTLPARSPLIPCRMKQATKKPLVPSSGEHRTSPSAPTTPAPWCQVCQTRQNSITHHRHQALQHLLVGAKSARLWTSEPTRRPTYPWESSAQPVRRVRSPVGGCCMSNRLSFALPELYVIVVIHHA